MLSELPNDMLNEIFKYLEWIDIKNIGLVNKKLFNTVDKLYKSRTKYILTVNDEKFIILCHNKKCVFKWIKHKLNNDIFKPLSKYNYCFLHDNVTHLLENDILTFEINRQIIMKVNRIENKYYGHSIKKIVKYINICDYDEIMEYIFGDYFCDDKIIISLVQIKNITTILL